MRRRFFCGSQRSALFCLLLLALAVFIILSPASDTVRQVESAVQRAIGPPPPPSPEGFTNFGRCNELECVECPSDFVPLDVRTSTIALGRVNQQSPRRANAVITVLCRNKELPGVLASLSSFEPLINSKLQYPYVFLNNEPFSQEFKDGVLSYLRKFRSSPDVKFSIIPKEHWSYPAHINQTLAAEIRKRTKDEYIYGGLESYRFMIRYFSGPFFHHPDLLQYDYYWRVEPDVDFFCEIDYDPFLFMERKKIKYGFNMMLPELMKTIPTLYDQVTDFRTKNELSLSKMGQMFEKQPCGGGYVGTGHCTNGECCSVHGWCGKTKDYCDRDNCVFNCDYSNGKSRHAERFEKYIQSFSKQARIEKGFCGGGNKGNGTCDDGSCCSKWGFCGTGVDYCGEHICIGGCSAKPDESLYTGLHFWSNFELADFRFFRGKEYTALFNHLDKAGGFFYERWGDAPVHSLAVGLFLSSEETHYFGDIGYRHADRLHCPTTNRGCNLKCNCKSQENGHNSINAWYRFNGLSRDKFLFSEKAKEDMK